MRVKRAAMIALSLSLMLPVLAYAQQAQTQTPPPAQKPAAPPAAAPAPRPPVPFPEGAKMAYLDIQRVAAESIEGKGYAAKVQALSQKKQKELEARNAQLQAAQQKLQQGANAMSEQAQAELQKQIDRLQVELQRAQQDAQAEVEDLQRQMQADFQRKVMPLIEQVAVKRALQMVFSTDAGIVWANQGLDITAEVIKAFDATLTQPAVKPPAPPK